MAAGVSQSILDTYTGVRDRRFDFNHDGSVGSDDFQLLKQNLGTHNWLYNLTDSGTVSRQDAALFLTEFPNAGSMAELPPVPEPSTIVLALLGMLGAAFSARRRVVRTRSCTHVPRRAELP